MTEDRKGNKTYVSIVIGVERRMIEEARCVVLVVRAVEGKIFGIVVIGTELLLSDALLVKFLEPTAAL